VIPEDFGGRGDRGTTEAIGERCLIGEKGAEKGRFRRGCQIKGSNKARNNFVTEITKKGAIAITERGVAEPVSDRMNRKNLETEMGMRGSCTHAGAYPRKHGG